jgi:hypothetical protein
MIDILAYSSLRKHVHSSHLTPKPPASSYSIGHTELRRSPVYARTASLRVKDLRVISPRPLRTRFCEPHCSLFNGSSPVFASGACQLISPSSTMQLRAALSCMPTLRRCTKPRPPHLHASQFPHAMATHLPVSFPHHHGFCFA